MPVAAIAGVAAAGIGAAGSIIAGNKAAKAQKSATKANTALQQEQDAEAKRQYDLARSDLAPYREAGYTALGQLGTGTKDGGDFNRSFTMADFVKDPGYDFRQAEGERGVEASAAARGGILSGGALKALARYNQDYASGEYGAAYNRFNNDMTTRYNRLAGLAQTGQTATNSGIAAGNELTGQLQTGVNNIASNNNAAANARASSYVNTGNAISGFLNSAASFIPGAPHG
jgi:hypothetical protein